MKRTGDLKLIQELNRSIILDVIRKKGPVSRAEIAKVIKISPSTVTAAVNDLIQGSLVCEVGMGESSGGRRPRLVQLNSNGCFIIGVAIDASKITIAELNLNAKVRLKEVHKLDTNMEINLTAYIIGVIEGFLNKCKELEFCLGISIVTQGIVDSVAGVIRYNPKLKVKNVQLKKIIEEHFNIPTVIDNDTNASLMAEKAFGIHKHSKNLIYVTIGDGVGAGILVNDSIFRGFHGGAGEFGHTTIDYKGPPCHCGNVGCLENYVSWQTIYARILTLIGNGENTLLTELAGDDPTKITPDIFRTAINQGDQLSHSIVDEIALYLSAGIVNLVNLYNPEKIIIGGDLAYKNPHLIKKVNELVSSQSLETLTAGLEVCASSFGDDVEVIGSVSLLLHDLFHFKLS